MDTLEEQLAQLKLLNSRPLSPRINNTPTSNGSPKKVGPAVPPKPMKKNFPQVPQSIVVQNTCEPLYSKRLQMDTNITTNNSNNQEQQSTRSSNLIANNNNNPNKLRFSGVNDNIGIIKSSSSGIINSNDNINNQPMLHRKQPAYSQQHVYSNIKMTLDNPAILDQQLEALEYHKKQLEKKGLMPTSGINKIIAGPKLSSASYINGDIAAAAASGVKVSPSVSMMTMMIEQQQQQLSSSPTPKQQQINMYSNINHNKQFSNSSSSSSSSVSSNPKLNIHSNLIDEQQQQQQQQQQDQKNQPDIVYSNIMHHSNNHYKKLSSTNLHNLNDGGNAQIYNNADFNTEDDFPPPPPSVENIPVPVNLTDPTACLEYLNQQQQKETSSSIIGNSNNCSTVCSGNSEDELPPPPSPVSSSYSELRRATDNYPQMPSYPMISSGYQQNVNNIDNNGKTITNDNINNHHHHHNHNNGDVNGGGIGNIIIHNDNGHGSRQSLNSSQLGSTVGPDSMLNPTDHDHHHHHSGQHHQTYMNTLYHNDYSTYAGPSSQSFSQSSSASDYYGYGSISQGSLTYDSIYEPINPRPTSQLSSRSNYSLYTSYVNGPQSNNSSGGSHTPTIGVNNNLSTIPIIGNSSVGSINNNNKLTNHKEAEVEALTDLLVHSMDSGNDVDTYGVCVKCGERVIGENSGCTAMDQIYHIACFTCNQCQINLQGKPFYALENNPYCKEDYLNTLEKCSVCMKPILERILRATGKPYHPQCFTCVVCDRSLDGIPFTVDATNQNYCIQDFHKKFAPRCCVCRQPIMPEPGQEETVRVVALDRSFHFECYKCEDCDLLLSSEAEGRGCYPLDDHVLCKSCNAKRVQALTNRMTTEL